MLKKLKTLREEAGISQKQLAEQIGVSQQSINKYENHNVEPDIHTLMQIADYFNTSVDFLIGYSDVRHRIEVCHAYELNNEESRIMDQYRQLNRKQRLCIGTLLDSYLN